VIRLQDGVFTRYTVHSEDNAQCYAQLRSLRGIEPAFSGKISNHENIPRSAIAGERRNIAAGATAMEFKTYTAFTLIVLSNAAYAWQPLTYPIRSQSAYQRGVDTAMCYAEANKKTKVNIAHESQIPPRKPPVTQTSSTGVPARPPLPPSTFSAAPMSASMPAATPDASASAVNATGTTTTAAAGTGASATKATGATGATGAATAGTTPGNSAGTTTAAAAPASATTADLGASDAAASGSLQANAASSVKLPPLPAPEPPMTQYWAAYGACMQARGYVVTQ